MKSAGVKVHSGYLLAQWNDGNGGDEIRSASFTSATKAMKIDNCGVSVPI